MLWSETGDGREEGRTLVTDVDVEKRDEERADDVSKKGGLQNEGKEEEAGENENEEGGKGMRSPEWGEKPGKVYKKQPPPRLDQMNNFSFTSPVSQSMQNVSRSVVKESNHSMEMEEQDNEDEGYRVPVSKSSKVTKKTGFKQTPTEEYYERNQEESNLN